MRVDLTIDRAGERRFDVALSGPSGMRLSDVLIRLRTMAGSDQRGEAWIAGNLVPATSLVGQEPIMPGSVVRLGSRGRPACARSSMLELRVIGGPDAGLAVDLPVGSKWIGRAADCDLVLSDPDVSRRHVRVTSSRERVLVEALRPTNRCTIDDEPVGADPASIRIGQIMRLGDSFLTLTGPDEPPVHREVRDGRIIVARRGHRRAATEPAEFALPGPPPPPSGRLAGTIAPTAVAIACGIAMALLIRSMQLLIISVAMPVAAFGAGIVECLHRRRAAKRRALEHREAVSAIESQIHDALQSEAASLRQNFPDVAALRRIATARTGRLWERHVGDPDLLSVRIGTGDLPSQAIVTRDGTPVTRLLRSVPVVVDLSTAPVGVIGPAGLVVKLVAYLICQLTTLCSPVDLEIVGVFTPHTARRWSWLRWLPHLRRAPATSTAEQDALAARLSEIIDQRRSGGASTLQGRWLLLLIDVGCAEVHPGIGRALATATCSTRIAAIGVAGASGGISCSTTVVLRGETGSRASLSTPAETVHAVADLMQATAADAVSRSLAPLVDGADGVDDPAGHAAAGLLTLLGLPALPSASDIAARWSQSQPAPRTAIGTADGRPLHVDLERDGPHGLIAGTTGSGKSECLQALVASLAASHPPDRVAFVLIDYKGGAAFASCAKLPHVAGLVTDLDPLLTQRALRTLECELRRRETLFAQHGISTFARYQTIADTPALPRLVIVVDEFAALAEDTPDLLHGLVGVAQRGRSLGVHLILATQRPAGVVSADIRANASLRIALRMTDPSESMDVIGTDRAADIDPGHPGAAIISRGGAMASVQIARVSGRTVQTPTTPSVTRLQPWRVVPPPPSPPHADDNAGDDLTALVDAIASAARLSTRPRAEPPWLPPLPSVLSATALPAPERCDVVHLGLVDLPADRAQPPTSVDLARGGTVVVAGSARSGKTTTAFGIAARAAHQLPPDRLRIVTIGEDIAALASLTDSSSALDAADFSATASALADLRTELAGRRRSASTYLILVLDGWEQFVSASDDFDLGRSIETLLQIAREAHRARCTVVITGDRNVLSPRVTSVADQVYVLKLADRADYGLVGIPRSAVPAQMAPGRALLAPDGHQVQLALPADTTQPMCGYR